jgi:hypothetical protein
MNIVLVDGMDSSLKLVLAGFAARLETLIEKHDSKKPVLWGREIETSGERRLQ